MLENTLFRKHVIANNRVAKSKVRKSVALYEKSGIYPENFFQKSVEKSGSFLLGIYEVYERLSNEINNFILILHLENNHI